MRYAILQLAPLQYKLSESVELSTTLLGQLNPTKYSLHWFRSALSPVQCKVIALKYNSAFSGN